ncbi:MAG: vWA domain-containing protein [Bacteroidota bacterium]
MFRLANPDYLILYAVIPVLIGLFFIYRLKIKKNKTQFADSRTFQLMTDDVSLVKPAVKFTLRSFALIFLITAMIRPQIGSGLEEVKRKGVDLVVALDVSNSMNATDIKPSRLERSVQSIERMIDKLQGDRIGIIVFAGNAFIQLPITTDYGAAKLFLSNINTNMVPTQGTAIGSAIEKSMETVGDSSKKSTAIIIMSDGENHEDDAIEAAMDASKKGFVIHTVGVGSASGSPIPDPRGNFIMDEDGKTVVSKMDEAMLQQIADAGGGKFYNLAAEYDGIASLLKEIEKLEKQEFASKMFTNYEEQFAWFLSLALLMLLIESMIGERKSKWIKNIKLFGDSKK